MKLDNSIAAVVTGGASGLGEATARRLAAAGVKVALFDMNAERGEKVAAEIGGLFVAVDVTSDESVTAGLAKARAAHGQERICVNCAGIVIGRTTVGKDKATGAMVAHDIASFAKVINVNLVGSFNVASKSAAGMAAHDPVNRDAERGVIVFTSSVAADDGQFGQAAYAASKAGIAGLTLPMARDLARNGVRVMAIKPGLFHTPMFDSLTDEVRASLAATVPFPSRLGSPTEYADLVAAICENPMLNGSSIRLDGAIRLAAK
ncbi:MAG: SDR family NAD(P)-dependent oxidoreductase [Hyphomicrobiaceae bacterium]|nr:SDR family NAD(P)-dependent oxidoreductase [Hyphomicrobiaceae bacterium]